MAFFIETSPYNMLLKCKDDPPFIRRDRAAKQREKFSRQNRKARNAQIARKFYANPEERRRANFGASSRAASFDSYFDEDEFLAEMNGASPKHSGESSAAPSSSSHHLGVLARNDTLATSSPEIQTLQTGEGLFVPGSKRPHPYRHSSPEIEGRRDSGQYLHDMNERFSATCHVSPVPVNNGYDASSSSSRTGSYGSVHGGSYSSGPDSAKLVIPQIRTSLVDPRLQNLDHSPQRKAIKTVSSPPITQNRRMMMMRKQQSEVQYESEMDYQNQRYGGYGKYMCVECREREKTVMVEPCRHVCWCQNCADAIMKGRGDLRFSHHHPGDNRSPCPLCGVPITSLVMVHH